MADGREEGTFVEQGHVAATVLLPPGEGSGTCPVRSILNHVSGRWRALVISNLAVGPLRFTELKRRVKSISQRMLTETPRGLERDGSGTRTLFPTVPRGIEYTLARWNRMPPFLHCGRIGFSRLKP